MRSRRWAIQCAGLLVAVFAAGCGDEFVSVDEGDAGDGCRALRFQGAQHAEVPTWRKNTDNCKAKPTEGLLPGYVDEQGTACLPPAVKSINTRPFVTVFPDGVLDAGETSALGKRHWEDGRVPSPGFGTDTEQRDDVAFVDHVIEMLMGDSDLDLDPSAIYVTGASNGGMMTLRLVCHFGDPRYPSLSRVAAFLASIGEMPEGLIEGQHGREACPSQVDGEVGFRIVLGTGIDTPDCPTYPCNSPVVTGDGLMPFGQAGGRYNVYSPDQGRVLSGPDTIAFWQSAFVAGMGSAGTTSDEMVGYFTQRNILSFAPSVTVLDTWVIDGGGHMLNATRMDFLPVASSWAFLSSFRRESAGLTRVDPDWVTGYW